MLIIIFFLLSFQKCHAEQRLELTASIAAEKFEDEGKSRHGVGVHSRYSYFSSPGLGAIAVVNFDSSFPGFVIGAGWRFRGANTFIDIGAGVTAFSIYGTDVALIPSFGYRISGAFFITLPILYRLGHGLPQAQPHLGYTF